MDRIKAERVDREARRILAELVIADFNRSEISRSSLAELSDLPRTTLRRKMSTGDLTVPELYRIAPLINANPMSWMARVEAGVALVRDAA